jgi:hypothetical protein
MSSAWKPNEFKVAINMAGAVSAGAYTAGVLDFLIEAIEEWEKAKTAFRAYLANPAPATVFEKPVPLHDITIEAFSGASAGGMCAAIASVMVQKPFEHITDPNARNTNNTFYEAWVNQIDIHKLLATDDLSTDSAVVSLLDSKIIDDIAAYALRPSSPSSASPSYISKQLTLFLTLTNVRGVPYKLYSDPSPNLDEFITYYADRMRFEVTRGTQPPIGPQAKPLPLDCPGTPPWDLLQLAAKATGAFPIFLAPRRIPRDLSDYLVPRWVPICDPDPDPAVCSDLPGPPAQVVDTLNVDGGITDNDPFDLAHDFLASMNPNATKPPNAMNPRGPTESNCAVISVAPFPSAERYDPTFDCAKAQGILQMLGRLVTVLISQSRFLGESLVVAASGPTFSRFIIAPSDDGNTRGSALQCARLGAFGGFFERSFRAHDFLLGRRNCQKFLQSYFLLPSQNPVIAAGQAAAAGYAATISERFMSDPPPGIDVLPRGKVWMPVIPLVGSAFAEVPIPARGSITKDAISKIADAVITRFGAIKGSLLDGAPAAWFFKLVLGLFCTWPTRLLVRGKIVDALTDALSPDVRN